MTDPATTTDNLFAHSGKYKFMRYSGTFLRYEAGKGWNRCDEPVGVRWFVLHELQAAAYSNALKELGLMNE